MNFIEWLKDQFKASPLIVMVVVSAVILSVVGFFIALVKGQYKLSMEQPPVQAVFTDIVQDEVEPNDTPIDIPVVPEAPKTDAPATLAPITGTPVTNVPTTDAPTTGAPTTDLTVTPTEEPEAPGAGQFIEIPKVTPRSSFYGSTGRKAVTTPYDYITVDKSYFEDAVFIGDSRIEDFGLFTKIPSDVFYARGLTVFNLLKNKVVAKDGSNTTITDAFGAKQYKKIYIMEGLNETGQFTTEAYAAKYKECIDSIMTLQPNAKIFILSTMYVTKDYSDAHDDVNNDNVDDKNQAVAEFADGKTIFYLDINPVTADENGVLAPKHTEDKVHLFAGSVYLWDQFLMEHGLKPEDL